MKSFWGIDIFMLCVVLAGCVGKREGERGADMEGALAYLNSEILRKGSLEDNLFQNKCPRI